MTCVNNCTCVQMQKAYVLLFHFNMTLRNAKQIKWSIAVGIVIHNGSCLVRVGQITPMRCDNTHVNAHMNTVQGNTACTRRIAVTYIYNQ